MKREVIVGSKYINMYESLCIDKYLVVYKNIVNNKKYGFEIYND